MPAEVRKALRVSAWLTAVLVRKTDAGFVVRLPPDGIKSEELIHIKTPEEVAKIAQGFLEGEDP